MYLQNNIRNNHLCTKVLNVFQYYTSYKTHAHTAYVYLFKNIIGQNN